MVDRVTTSSRCAGHVPTAANTVRAIFLELEPGSPNPWRSARWRSARCSPRPSFAVYSFVSRYYCDPNDGTVPERGSAVSARPMSLTTMPWIIPSRTPILPVHTFLLPLRGATCRFSSRRGVREIPTAALCNGCRNSALHLCDCQSPSRPPIRCGRWGSRDERSLEFHEAENVSSGSVIPEIYLTPPPCFGSCPFWHHGEGLVAFGCLMGDSSP